MIGYMATQVKVGVCGLGLLWPELSAGPVSDDSTAEDAMRKCGTIKVNLLSFLLDDVVYFLCRKKKRLIKISVESMFDIDSIVSNVLQ